ncbi:probable WRKY transcription factor 70 [Typha latifolia]|uniref:probable WRKY transcription factor 70 n=1 Tax=Typha latifolia TaxID=4733 RepID=UPI003C2C76DC
MASPVPLPFPFDHLTVIEEINRGRELTVELRALVLGSTPSGDGCSEMVREHFEKILKCCTMALSLLQSDGCRWPTAGGDGEERSKISLAKQDNKLVGHKRRRQVVSPTVITTVPHYDGHQWRKYGEKMIKGFKYPRSYYRCTYSKEQGCRATKTVQKEDDGGSLPNFAVVYTSPHTCETDAANSPFVVDSSSQNLTQEKQQQQSSPTSYATVENLSQYSSPCVSNDQQEVDRMFSQLTVPEEFERAMEVQEMLDLVENFPLDAYWDLM